MNRNPPKRRASPRIARAAKTDDSAALIGSLALEALDRLVGLLARNGIRRAALERAFRHACDKHLRGRPRPQMDSVSTQYEASLVLAAWHTDLEYLDGEGRPLPLSLNGSTPSLHSLIKRVGPRLSVPEMVRHLERIRALRHVGQKYAPRRRAEPLLSTGSLASREILRMVVRLLRSLDENRACRRTGNLDEIKVVTALGNTEVPVRLRSVCRAQLTRDIQQFLREVDSRMLRYERARVSDEPLVHTGIGVFHFEDPVPAAAQRADRRKRTHRERRAPTASRTG